MSKKGIVFISILICLTVMVQAAGPVGKIVSVKGDSFIARKLKAKKPAQVGMDVFEKDRIKTKANGEVVIDMFGASELTIGPKSYFKIKKKSKNATNLDLFSGQIKCKVAKLDKNSSFTVKTPSAVAGVRGTEFGTYLDDNMNCLVTCKEGSVWNADPDNPGNKIIVNQNKMSMFFANGDSIQGDYDPNSNVVQMAQQQLQKMQEDQSNEFLASRENNISELREQLQQALEERVDQIESRLEFIAAEQAKKDLPEPPTTPNTN